MSMSPKVIVKTNILKLCEKLLKEVAKPPKIADLGSPCWLGDGMAHIWQCLSIKSRSFSVVFTDEELDSMEKQFLRQGGHL